MIKLGDSFKELDKLDKNSVDGLITDIPYNLGFMNKDWDSVGGAKAYQHWNYNWSLKALRVLKPGAFALVFGGRETIHRAICGFEDAGWEIRDVILWFYLSGFPKGMDLSKAIDKHFGNKRPRGREKKYADGGKASDRKKIGEALNRSVFSDGSNKAGEGVVYETLPVAEEAIKWEGYRTCLKPAYEPIVLMRKPLDGTYVENILKWDVGGINVDGTRVPLNIEYETDSRIKSPEKNYKYTSEHQNAAVDFFGKNGVRDERIQQLYDMKGRYPSNVIISECISELFDMISGTSDPKGMSKFFVNVDWCNPTKELFSYTKRSFEHFNLRDGGGMGKFFYTPKASTRERELGLDDIEKDIRDKSRNGDPANPYNRNHKVKNFHPTVKPIKLMTYLVRLIRPPRDCVILDPFAGSGTTALACKIENCDYIMIEKNPEYFKIMKKRLEIDIEKFQDFTDNIVNRKQVRLVDLEW